LKNHVRIVAIFLLVVTVASVRSIYYQQKNIDQTKDNNDETPSNLPAYRLAVRNLNNALEKNASSELNQIFSNVYVDPDTNTVHVTLTRIDEASQQLVLEATGSQEGVTVVFHEGPANQQQLDEWMTTINAILPELMEKGVNYSIAFVNKDALIEIRLIEPTPENVEILYGLIGDKIPREFIVVKKGSPVQPA